MMKLESGRLEGAQTDMQADELVGTLTGRQADRQASWHKDRQTNRKAAANRLAKCTKTLRERLTD